MKRRRVINNPGSQEKVREGRRADRGDESNADKEPRNRQREHNESAVMRFQEGGET